MVLKLLICERVGQVSSSINNPCLLCAWNANSIMSAKFIKKCELCRFRPDLPQFLSPKSVDRRVSCSSENVVWQIFIQNCEKVGQFCHKCTGLRRSYAGNIAVGLIYKSNSRISFLTWPVRTMQLTFKLPGLANPNRATSIRPTFAYIKHIAYVLRTYVCSIYPT